MITAFGKFCRKLRIDNDELLQDMATKLGITASYLSAVENGKRNIPHEWVDKIKDLYSLDNEKYHELINSVQESQLDLKIRLSEFNNEDRNILLTLAKRLGNFNKIDRDTIKTLLFKNDEETVM